MRKYRKWRKIVIEQLAIDSDAALDYIQFAMEEYQVDRDATVFLLALRTFVESQGGIAELAKKTGLDEKMLSKTLSCEKAPRIDTLATILTPLGCRLSIERIKDEDMSSYIEPTGETEIPKFANEQTQLVESDST
jgi:DNA-binding phage protein